MRRLLQPCNFFLRNKCGVEQIIQFVKPAILFSGLFPHKTRDNVEHCQSPFSAEFSDRQRSLMEAPLQTILMKAKVMTKATKNVTTRMMVNIYI